MPPFLLRVMETPGGVKPQGNPKKRKSNSFEGRPFEEHAVWMVLQGSQKSPLLVFGPPLPRCLKTLKLTIALGLNGPLWLSRVPMRLLGGKGTQPGLQAVLEEWPTPLRALPEMDGLVPRI